MATPDIDPPRVEAVPDWRVLGTVLVHLLDGAEPDSPVIAGGLAAIDSSGLMADHLASPSDRAAYRMARGAIAAGLGAAAFQEIADALDGLPPDQMDSELAEVGGRAFLAAAIRCTGALTIDDVADAARRVRSAWIRRRLIEVGGKIAGLGTEAVEIGFNGEVDERLAGVVDQLRETLAGVEHLRGALVPAAGGAA